MPTPKRTTWKTPVLTYLEVNDGYNGRVRQSLKWYFCCTALAGLFNLGFPYPSHIRLVAKSRPTRGYRKVTLEDLGAEIAAPPYYSTLHDATKETLLQLGIVKNSMSGLMRKKTIYVQLVICPAPAQRRT